MTLPNEVREAAIAAVIENIGPIIGNPEYLARPGNVERLEARRRNAAASHVDAALSALEAAGWEVNRKGTREALALAAERLAVAASRIDRADTEFGFRVWADEARNVAGRAIVDLAAEPQFRLTLSEEARAEIERLERANAAAAANLGNILIGSASNPKEKPDV